ncbi:hypothetical protein Aperf_G00000043383 [Anoplocephala perfoliata]
MEFEEVMDHFERADVDLKGFLTREELKDYFMSFSQNTDFIDDWFKWFDLDNKGVIEAEDVCTTLGMPMPQSYADRIKARQEKQVERDIFFAESGQEQSVDVQNTSTESLDSSHSTSTRSIDGDGEDTKSQELNSIPSSTTDVTSDSRAHTHSESRSAMERTVAGDVTIEEMPMDLQLTAPIPHFADPELTARRASIENLRNSFEILHEDSVNEELLSDVMRIVKKYEGKVHEEKEMAKLLKDGVEEKHGRHWQAIVAYTNLGCNVEHEINTFVYLRKNNYIYILFRTPIGE